MERTDYIEKREDIISNIETLYSYLHGESGEDYKQWAIDRLKLGKNMVVEVINGHICFAPSRFVGYLNNTREKNEEKPGNGTDTDKVLKTYYNKVLDGRLEGEAQEKKATIKRLLASSASVDIIAIATGMSEADVRLLIDEISKE